MGGNTQKDGNKSRRGGQKWGNRASFLLAGLLLPVVYINQPKLCGIPNQLHCIMNIQFVHNVSPMILDRLGANKELLRNFPGGEALCQ
jgi:hypothetical protein